MNNSYTKEFILSFEDQREQQRFEELEETIRKLTQFLEMYEENSKRCKKIIMRNEPTVEIQQIISTMNLLESRIKKWKTRKYEFLPEMKERKSIQPTEQEIERLNKSMSLPVIKIKESSQRNAEYKVLFEEFEGQFYQMTKYKSGNTLLMKLIEQSTDKELQNIMEELYDHLDTILIHQNGQYLLPIIMEKRNDEINERIFTYIQKRLIFYCCDLFGGYTIQKITPFLKDHIIIQWLPLLKENLCTLILHQHGNYVIQTFLKSFQKEYNDFFFDGILSCITRICTEKIGCSVLINAMNLATIQQLQKITPSLLNYCNLLLIDQYGNFILQHLIDQNPSTLESIIHCLLSNIVFYCNNKYSSNVVEKCLLYHSLTLDEKCKEKQKTLRLILREKKILSQLLDNQYGNFVVQAVIDSTPKDQQEILIKIIRDQLSSHSQFSYFIEKKLKTTQLL